MSSEFQSRHDLPQVGRAVTAPRVPEATSVGRPSFYRVDRAGALCETDSGVGRSSIGTKRAAMKIPTPSQISLVLDLKLYCSTSTAKDRNMVPMMN